ncbi:MAG: hypothetical protein IJW28_03690 [Clostridia bacterium]|nr:hypothetical protein [Clostridia bacterium]
MIINGNYIYPSFKQMIPKLIETFVEYYGESHREYITSRMKQVDVHFFTGFESIEDYVDAVMPKVRDTVIDDMLVDLKVDKKSYAKVKDALFESVFSTKKEKVYAMGDYSKLALASLCGNSDFETTFKPHEKKRLLAFRDDICSAFGLKSSNDATKNMFIKSLDEKRKAYYTQISKRIGPVGLDEYSVEKNEKKAMFEYYKFASKYFKFSDSDLKKINTSNCYVLETLDCQDLFMVIDIHTPGRIADFTTESEKALSGNDVERKNIVLKGRIRHFKMMGLDLNESENEDLEIVYNRYLEAGATKLMIQPNIADKLEHKREALSKDVQSDLAYVKDFKKKAKMYLADWSLENTFGDLPNNHETNFIINHKKELENRGVISLDCDIHIHPDDVLRVLIHELGHHMQAHISGIQPKKDVYECKDSIARKEKFNLGMPEHYGVHTELKARKSGVDNLIEYFNEKQAEELVKIYLRKYKNPFTPSDVEVESDTYDSLYKKCDLIIGHIFETYKKDIKEECISGKPTFSEPYGYRKLRHMDSVLGKFYDEDWLYDDEVNDMVYLGKKTHLSKEAEAGIRRYRALVAGIEKTM